MILNEHELESEKGSKANETQIKRIIICAFLFQIFAIPITYHFSQIFYVSRIIACYSLSVLFFLGQLYELMLVEKIITHFTQAMNNVNNLFIIVD